MTINYKFKCIDLSDYELTFTMKAESKLFDSMFQKSVKKLVEKNKIDKTDFDTNKIDKFEIIPKFYNLILIALKSKIKKIKKMVSKDRILVLNHKCKKAYFVRDTGNNWDIIILIGGQYVKK